MESTATNQVKPVPERWPDRLLRRWPRKVAEELFEAEAQVAQLQATVGQLREGIELAFATKLHPFETDEARDYCQCGYYKNHPVHMLAALATCPAPEEK